MTRRPDPFNRAKLVESLLESGCPPSFVSATISNYRLFVPLLFVTLGEDRIFELVEGTRAELGLGKQESAWRSSVKYLIAWAEEVLEEYKARRTTRLVQPPPKKEVTQPRLL